MMRVLAIGGTGFLGRHLSEAVLRWGFDLTVFNRGRTAPGLFADVERLPGDRRTGDLEALAGREFDAVIDTCGYLPDEVRAMGEFLAGSVGHYTFVSSIAVYPDPVAPGTDESAPVASLEGPIPESPTDEAYGALKALCERAAEEALPGRVLSVRSGLIAGPGDPTDRFTYWPRRVARGGRVLAPRRGQPVQFIDGRDLAEWIVNSLEAGLTGTFNAVGPAAPLTMARLLEACGEVSGTGAEPVWAGDDFLTKHGVVPWTGLPLWVPARASGFLEIDSSLAISHGLRFRPARDTIADVLDWDRGRPSPERLDRLPPTRERELLEALGALRFPG